MTFQTGDVDFSDQGTKVLASKPDWIIISSNHGEGANVPREARKQGFNRSVMSGLGLCHIKYAENAGPAAEGTCTVTSTGANMYGMIYFLEESIEEGGVGNKPADLSKDRGKIMKGLSSVKNYQDITDSITIDSNGDALRTEHFVFVVKGGKFIKL